MPADKLSFEETARLIVIAQTHGTKFFDPDLALKDLGKEAREIGKALIKPEARTPKWARELAASVRKVAAPL